MSDRPAHDWLTVRFQIKPDRRRSATAIDASRERRRPLIYRHRTDLDADARALLRMEDDGWGGAAGSIAPAAGTSRANWGIPPGTVPGEREPGPQTRF
jgi:hypothetical protein